MDIIGYFDDQLIEHRSELLQWLDAYAAGVIADGTLPTCKD